MTFICPAMGAGSWACGLMNMTFFLASSGTDLSVTVSDQTGRPAYCIFASAVKMSGYAASHSFTFASTSSGCDIQAGSSMA